VHPGPGLRDLSSGSLSVLSSLESLRGPLTHSCQWTLPVKTKRALPDEIARVDLIPPGDHVTARPLAVINPGVHATMPSRPEPTARSDPEGYLALCKFSLKLLKCPRSGLPVSYCDVGDPNGIPLLWVLPSGCSRWFAASQGALSPRLNFSSLIPFCRPRGEEVWGAGDSGRQARSWRYTDGAAKKSYCDELR
jgi:hypothetical protein